MNTALNLWFMVGFWYAFKHASGEPISKIENDWQRKVAWLLTLPAFVFMWFVVRSCEYLCLLAKDIPQTLKVAADSWHGITTNEVKE